MKRPDSKLPEFKTSKGPSKFKAPKATEGEVKLIDGRPRQFVGGRWVKFGQNTDVTKALRHSVPKSPLGGQSIKPMGTKKTKLKIY